MYKLCYLDACTVDGTKKWIGAMEVAGLLLSFGIPAFDRNQTGSCLWVGVYAQVVDFQLSSPAHNHQAMLDWVWEHFQSRTLSPSSSSTSSSSSSSPCPARFVPPLYLQHQGHSRTIVGVVRTRGVIRLLILDPDCGGGAWHMRQSLQDPHKIRRVWSLIHHRG